MRSYGWGISEYLTKEALGSYRLQARGGAKEKLKYMYEEEKLQKVG